MTMKKIVTVLFNVESTSIRVPSSTSNTAAQLTVTSQVLWTFSFCVLRYIFSRDRNYDHWIDFGIHVVQHCYRINRHISHSSCISIPESAQTLLLPVHLLLCLQQQ